jgi:predicted protein tyrosine phosphatase
MRPTIFTVERKGPGTISTMGRPRGGDWLDDEVSALRAIGVGVLVSTLTASESRELELSDEPQAARSVGLRFLSLPTPDRGAPEKSGFLALLDDLEGAVRSDHVVVHCRMGIGRSSLVAPLPNIVQAQFVQARDRSARPEEVSPILVVHSRVLTQSRRSV